jgi:ribosomal protein S18 acetylase RimI-like enzyme
VKTQYYIRKISVEKTHAIRHPMLRQGRPLKDCVFEGDNDPETIHLGAYIENKLVGVLSAYQKSISAFDAIESYQVRGVAVLTSAQRKGIGRALMVHIEQLLQQRKIDLIWLNARIKAVEFYTALAYRQKGSAFEIEGIGTHYCFYKSLK